MRRIVFVFVLVALSFPLCAAPAAPTPKETPQDTWALFRGNALQTGVATGKLPDKLVELWTFTTNDSIEGGPDR